MNDLLSLIYFQFTNLVWAYLVEDNADIPAKIEERHTKIFFFKSSKSLSISFSCIVICCHLLAGIKLFCMSLLPRQKFSTPNDLSQHSGWVYVYCIPCRGGREFTSIKKKEVITCRVFVLSWTVFGHGLIRLPVHTWLDFRELTLWSFGSNTPNVLQLLCCEPVDKEISIAAKGFPAPHPEEESTLCSILSLIFLQIACAIMISGPHRAINKPTITSCAITPQHHDRTCEPEHNKYISFHRWRRRIFVPAVKI